ncbi:hypothetical protein D3C72_1907780 [compost metagenome]
MTDIPRRSQQSLFFTRSSHQEDAAFRSFARFYRLHKRIGHHQYTRRPRSIIIRTIVDAITDTIGIYAQMIIVRTQQYHFILQYRVRTGYPSQYIGWMNSLEGARSRSFQVRFKNKGKRLIALH